jgi:peptidoglycan/LPS O-acetylase OafA/YrhL
MAFHFWVYEAQVPAGATLTVGEQAWRSTRWALWAFFVLSGYLIYRPWVRAALAGGERPDLRRYICLRAARIAPGYYLALAGTLLIAAAGAVPPMRTPNHDTLPLFLVFGQNFSDHSLSTLDGPMWTLPIEVSFYLALPAIAVATLRLGRSRASQVLLTAALVAIGVAWAQLASRLWLYDTVLPQMLPYFALGMLVAVLIEGRRIPARSCRWLVVGVLAGYAVNLALYVGAPGLAGALEDLPVALGFAGLVAVGAAGEWVPWVMRARAAVWLGVVSYGAYLWHQPIMALLAGHGVLPRDIAIEAVLVLPVTLLVAWASWCWLERPILRRAHAGPSRRRAPPRIPRGPRRGIGRPAAAPSPAPASGVGAEP